MHFLEKIAKWVVLGGTLLLTLSPFFVTPNTAFPAVFTRVIVVRTVIGIMLLAYLFLAFFFQKYRPRKSAIAYTVGIFVLAFLISTFAGINPYRSFWGSHERMEGFVTLLHFGALFLVLFGTLRTTEDYKKILWASVVVSVAQSFYSFGQMPGIDIQATKLYANDTSRVSGTFGNATILALYLIFQTFFAGMLMFWEQSRWKRWLLAGIILVDVIAIFVSGTRGALLGVYGGAVVLGLAYVLFTGSKKLRIAGACAVVLVVGGLGTLYAFRESQFVQDRYLLQRATVFLAAKSTITSRSMAWKIGVEAWKDRFWFGYGMENYNYAFNHYYSPWMLYYDSGDFDRPHNRFVDSLVTGGFVGFVAHLAVFATATWFLLRKWWSNRSFFFPLAGLCLLGAYALQLSTLFDHMISYQFFAVLLALLATWQASTATREEGEAAAHDAETSAVDFRAAALKEIAMVAAIIGFSIFTWHAHIVPTEASYWAQVASNTNYSSQGEAFPEAMAALKKSFDLNTYLNVDMRLALSGFATSQARTSMQDPAQREEATKTLEYLAGQFEANLNDYHPDIKDFLSHLTYARIAQSLTEVDVAWQDKALATMEQAVEEYPKKAQIIQGLARYYLQLGRIDDAVRVFEKHPLEFARGDFYFDYAAALYSAGRNEDAWTQIMEARRVGYDFTKNLGKLVDILLADGKLARVIDLYELQLKTYQQGDTQLMASLAQSYKEAGDLENARRVAQMLLEADPQNSGDTQDFLNNLTATSVASPPAAGK